MKNPFRLVQPKTKMYSMAVNLKTIKRIASCAKEGQVDLEKINALADVAADCLLNILELLPDVIDMKIDIREDEDVVNVSSMEELEDVWKELLEQKPPEGTKMH